MKKSLRTRFALLACVPLLLSACSSDPTNVEPSGETSRPSTAATPGGSTSEDPSPSEENPAPALDLSIVKDSGVKFDQVLTVKMLDGDLTKVRVWGTRVGEMGESEEKKVRLPGTRRGGVWTATSFMEPSTSYRVTAKDGASGETLVKKFQTLNLPLAKQTYPTLFPSGGTFGVGQPVVVRFDVPVTNPAAIEKRLEVKTVPKQVGAWRWISSTEVRYRPKTYWKPGTRVEVSALVNSVPAGNGVFGQFDRASTFKIGGVSKVLRVNLATKELRAFENGKLVKTLPISAGKPGFITRSGTKVIMAKHRYYDMNSSTIGIDPNSAEGYDLSDVEYAMRITNSGEFIHASPWNNGLHGVANLSHGCTGLSTADTGWIFNWAPVGTPVEYVGSDRQMTVDNGWGDWSMKWSEYKKGSAV